MLEFVAVRLSGAQALSAKILTSTEQIIAFWAHFWSDTRLSIIARLLLLFVPIYVLSPFDLLPDYLPGGLLDDFSIFAIFGTIIKAMIPKSVITDAKKAAACGLVFCGIAASFHSIAPCNDTRSQTQSASLDFQQIKIESSRQGLKSLSADTKLRASHNKTFCNSNTEFSFESKVPLLSVNEIASKQKNGSAFLQVSKQHKLLFTRAGQKQNYSDEDLSWTNLHCVALLLPPQWSCGSFSLESCKRIIALPERIPAKATNLGAASS